MLGSVYHYSDWSGGLARVDTARRRKPGQRGKFPRVWNPEVILAGQTIENQRNVSGIEYILNGAGEPATRRYPLNVYNLKGIYIIPELEDEEWEIAIRFMPLIDRELEIEARTRPPPPSSIWYNFPDDIWNPLRIAWTILRYTKYRGGIIIRVGMSTAYALIRRRIESGITNSLWTPNSDWEWKTTHRRHNKSSPPTIR